MAVPESAGGSGATLLDAAVVCEATGAAVAPVPVVEAIAAARLLAALPAPAARDLLDRVIAGDVLVTIALGGPDGTGTARWVPAGAIADVVLVLDGQRVLAAATGGAGRLEQLSNLGALPVADCAVSGANATVIAEGPDAVAAFEVALAEWRVLTAAALCGAGL